MDLFGDQLIMVPTLFQVFCEETLRFYFILRTGRYRNNNQLDSVLLHSKSSPFCVDDNKRNHGQGKNIGRQTKSRKYQVTDDEKN